MSAQELLQEISDYCRHSGLAESTFGRRAVNDGKLTARLRNGGRITTETLDRIRAFMEINRSAALARPTVIVREPRPGNGPGPLAAAPATAPAPAPTGERDPQRFVSSITGKSISSSSTPAAKSGWSPAGWGSTVNPSAPPACLSMGVGDGIVLLRRCARCTIASPSPLRGRQNQPRGRPARAAENPTAFRASRDGAGADQSRLCRRALARGQVAFAAREPGLAGVPLAGNSAYRLSSRLPTSSRSWRTEGCFT